MAKLPRVTRFRDVPVSRAAGIRTTPRPRQPPLLFSRRIPHDRSCSGQSPAQNRNASQHPARYSNVTGRFCERASLVMTVVYDRSRRRRYRLGIHAGVNRSENGFSLQRIAAWPRPAATRRGNNVSNPASMPGLIQKKRAVKDPRGLVTGCQCWLLQPTRAPASLNRWATYTRIPLAQNVGHS